METIAKDNRIHEPIIDTERLILRPLTQADAAVVQFLAGHKVIAATTLSIPHPYSDGVALKWIKSIKGDFAEGKSVVFAITENSNGNLLGTIGLMINREHNHAEVGYWIGFEKLGLNRIFAQHFKGNDASACVMRKIGMTYEGSSKGHIKKWNQYKDIENYGITKKDYSRSEQSYRLTGIPFSERYSFI
jgi:[ribosomal protein S5]-alanine N-acetyltransferase